MSQNETPTPPDAPSPPPRRRMGGAARGLTALAVGVGVAVALGLVGWAARREAAEHVAVRWLEARGVEADVRIDRLDTHGLRARLVVGPADDPDLTLEQVEVDYGLSLFSFQPRRVRLVRPQVRARLEDGVLSFGALDPLIREFSQRPPSGTGGAPLILVEDGAVRLQTPGGDALVHADAWVRDGRVTRLDARMPAARLSDGERRLSVQAAGLALRTRGDDLVIAVVVRGLSGEAMEVRAEQADARLMLAIPYPDLTERRLDGPARLVLAATAARLGWGDAEAAGAETRLTFNGRFQGGTDAFSMSGPMEIEARVGLLDAVGTRTETFTLAAATDDLRLERGERLHWRARTQARLSADRFSRDAVDIRDMTLTLTDATGENGTGGGRLNGRLGVTARAFHQDALVLTGLDGGFDLSARLGEAFRLGLNGALRTAAGRWTVLGAPAATDVPEQAALKRAFADFSLSAPGLNVEITDRATRVHLTREARITPRSGGAVAMRTPGAQPLYASGTGSTSGGAFLLTAEGGGLPDATIRVLRYEMGRGAITARLEADAAFDFGLARGARVQAVADMRIHQGRTVLTAQGCMPFTAALIDMGDNDVRDVSASLCPMDEPLLTLAEGWRFRAEARQVTGAADALGMAFEDGRAVVTAADRGGDLQMEARVSDVLVHDLEESPRFHPVRAEGRMRLADQDWTGGFTLMDGKGRRPVAILTVTHAGRTGVGGIGIDARGLTFGIADLQPADLSPLAQRIANAEAVGEVDFTGAFRWTADAATSSGVLISERLDFVSPAGPVTRLSGRVDFTSLAPLETAPAQRITVERIESFLPLLALEAEFDLNADRLRLADGRLETAGGVVSLETTEIPLDPNAAFEGVLVLEHVQLGELVGRSGFAEQMMLDAVVSGRLPFVAGPQGVTIIDGHVTADQPGRLAIAREALTGVQAEGGAEATTPNTVQDFAYQALEHLAFDHLEARLNSLPEGRLGVLFTIHGRHAPPQQQEIRLTWMDVLRQRFLDRPLPLPSGTQINLTLDSSFNLNQLVSDLMEIQRARDGTARSETVQPQRR